MKTSVKITILLALILALCLSCFSFSAAAAETEEAHGYDCERCLIEKTTKQFLLRFDIEEDRINELMEGIVIPVLPEIDYSDEYVQKNIQNFLEKFMPADSFSILNCDHVEGPPQIHVETSLIGQPGLCHIIGVYRYTTCIHCNYILSNTMLSFEYVYNHYFNDALKCTICNYMVLR